MTNSEAQRDPIEIGDLVEINDIDDSGLPDDDGLRGVRGRVVGEFDGVFAVHLLVGGVSFGRPAGCLRRLTEDECREVVMVPTVETPYVPPLGDDHAAYLAEINAIMGEYSLAIAKAVEGGGDYVEYENAIDAALERYNIKIADCYRRHHGAKARELVRAARARLDQAMNDAHDEHDRMITEAQDAYEVEILKIQERFPRVRNLRNA